MSALLHTMWPVVSCKALSKYPANSLWIFPGILGWSSYWISGTNGLSYFRLGNSAAPSLTWTLQGVCCPGIWGWLKLYHCSAHQQGTHAQRHFHTFSSSWYKVQKPRQRNCYQEQVGPCSPPPPSRQNSRGKGLMIQERFSIQQPHSFGITAFHMH